MKIVVCMVLLIGIGSVAIVEGWLITGQAVGFCVATAAIAYLVDEFTKE